MVVRDNVYLQLWVTTTTPPAAVHTEVMILFLNSLHPHLWRGQSAEVRHRGHFFTELLHTACCPSHPPCTVEVSKWSWEQATACLEQVLQSICVFTQMFEETSVETEDFIWSICSYVYPWSLPRIYSWKKQLLLLSALESSHTHTHSFLVTSIKGKIYKMIQLWNFKSKFILRCKDFIMNEKWSEEFFLINAFLRKRERKG